MDHDWLPELSRTTRNSTRELAAQSERRLANLEPPRGHVRSKTEWQFDKAWAERTVPECFTEPERRWRADWIALSGANGNVSYGELDRLSDQIAQAIGRLGGRRPEPVALLLEHEAPVPAAMLGVLKAGNFFVPLDPSYPTDRNRYVLEDSEARLLITNDKNLSLAASLGANSGRLVNLDEIAATALVEYPRGPITPDDLAYVLYTSGSTGEPKGVMRTHRGLMHNVKRGTEARQIGCKDRVALLFSYSFSAAVGNVFTALLNGATVLPFNLKELGVSGLADWLIEHEITHFHTVPTIFRHFTDGLKKSHVFPQLRVIQLGGETMFAADVERFRRHFGSQCLLKIGMGTSEAGHLFEFGVDSGTECSTDILPVGYPVRDTEILLLDTNAVPVEVGRIGEIAVRGSFVSPGYWRRPELTAKKFRTDPNGGNERTYLTGDLGCMLPDGCVFHLGRNDDRVRIRSQSVEIPEVEAALLHVPGVREAAVTAEMTSTGDPRLVAYIVSSPGIRLTGIAVRRMIGERLPAFMVPSSFVVLDALPLLPNGKIDRRSLSAFRQSRPEQELCRAPRTAVELVLTMIWAQLLDIERVGVDDNFFELGGHSLLAMRLLAQIETTLGKRLSIATLYEAPTIEAIASILGRVEGTFTSASLVALQPQGSKPPFFWVHGEDSNAFLPRYLGPDQPVYGLLEQSWDGKRALYTSVEDIAAYYLRGIHSVQPNGPYFLGGYCFGGIVAFEIAQQLRKQGHEVGLLAMVDPPYRVPRHFKPDGGRQRLIRHLRRLGALTLPEQLTYLRERFVSMIRERLTAMTERAKKFACQVYMSAGLDYRIPIALRSRYILTLHSRAKRAYARQAYPGRLVVLQTAEESVDVNAAWEGLPAGGLEIRRLPGRHADVVNDVARIQDLARELKACLERAQSAGGAELSAAATVCRCR